MLSSLIQVMGPWFLAAIALEAVAVFAEQWGAVRSPDEEVRKHGALALLALVLSLLTPGLLLAHGYITTRTQEQTLLVLAVGLPLAAVLVGALLGAIMGAAAKDAAPLMRKLALPLDILAFAVTIYATLATIQVLIQAAQNGGIVSVTT
jgi:hypothetical protein